MDRFKIVGILLTVTGITMGSLLLYYEHLSQGSILTQKSNQKQVLGVSDIRKKLNLPNDSSLDSDLSTDGSQNKNLENLLKQKVSPKCNQTFDSKNWSLSNPKISMNLSAGNQIIVVDCNSNSANSAFNTFLVDSSKSKNVPDIKLLEFEVFDQSQKKLITTPDVAFSPSNNYPYPQQFSALLSTKLGFNCGQMSYYKWNPNSQQYSLSLLKNQNCQNSIVGQVNDTNWSKLYPSID